MKLPFLFLTNLILLCFLFLISSCQNNKKSILTKECIIENDSTYLFIREINGNKINSNNVEQCEKYGEINFYIDSLTIYGADLRKIFGTVYNIQTKFINIHNQNLNNIEFEICLKNKFQNMKLDTTIITNYLQNNYKFNIDTSFILTKVWNFEIFDSLLFFEKTKINKEIPNVTVTEEKIQIINLPITVLINTLNENYNEILVLNCNLKGNYTFKIKLENFVSLKKQLYKYGVKVNESKMLIKYLNIN